MWFLQDLLLEYLILAIAQVALVIWMLVDCSRRHADYLWYWVILLFQPFGAWIYFVVVKAKDFRGSPGLAGGWLSYQRRPSLDELQYRAGNMPTLANHLALAQ